MTMKNTPIYVSHEEINQQQEIMEAFSHIAHRPQTYHIVTYGCQMNAHDSEKLAGILRGMGMSEVREREKADFVLFNTCCIRDNAERRALGNVTWLKEIKKSRPGFLIGICGCMIQQPHMAEKILKRYPFIDLAFGTHNLHHLPSLLYRVVLDSKRVVSVMEQQGIIAEG